MTFLLISIAKLMIRVRIRPTTEVMVVPYTIPMNPIFAPKARKALNGIPRQ